MSNALPPCFQNYLGVRGACPPAQPPSTGLYVNDLEGISLRMGAQAAAEEFTGARFFEERIDLALKLMVEELRGMALEEAGYGAATHLARHLAGAPWPGKYLPAAPLPRGIRLQLRHARSPLQQIFLERATFTANDTVNGKTLLVDDGGQYSSFSFDAVAGQRVEIPLNYYAASTDVRLLVDGSDVQVNDSRLNGFDGGRWVLATGWDGQAATDRSFGVQVYFSVRCRFEEVACALAGELGPAALLRAGVEIMRGRRESERVNAFTAEPARAEKLAQEWQARYESLARAALRNNRSLFASFHDDCLPCRHARTSFAMP